MRAAFRLFLLLTFFCAGAAPLARAGEPPIDWHEPPPDPAGAADLTLPEGAGAKHSYIPDRLVPASPFQRLPAQDESGFVIVDTRAVPWWQAGTLDPVLTNACRLGDFASVPLNRMIVRFEPKGEGRGQLRVILADRRHLLVDVRHLAAPGEIYYFRDSAEPSCKVWVGNLVAPRRLNPPGTSLAKADPKGRQKELELFKTWHKLDAPAAPAAQPAAAPANP